jgi:predicted TPR repeat methyltransferase
MTRKFLKEVYDLKTRGDVQEYYNAWAKSYDAEVAENGYATPGRCAEALQSVGVPSDAAILDLGCGTGLSGLAMRARSFTTIDGTDLSPGMLSQAEMRNVYRTLFTSTAGSPPILHRATMMLSQLLV